MPGLSRPLPDTSVYGCGRLHGAVGSPTSPDWAEVRGNRGVACFWVSGYPFVFGYLNLAGCLRATEAAFMAPFDVPR